MTTYFTADLHLGHTNILRHCDRPFGTVEDMNDEILHNINAVVERHDDLYILGDFCWSNKFPEIKEYRDRIECRNVFLVRGNHDGRSIESYRKLFHGVWDQKLIEVEGQKIFLNHYPMRSWNHSFRGSFHLYGHVHGTLPARQGYREWDVGVDKNEFKPVPYETIKLYLGW